MTRTWFSSATKSSRYSGSKTPCRRSPPSTKRFIKNPDSMRPDSNSTDVFTQPASIRDAPQIAKMRKKRTFPIGVALGQIDHLVVLTTVVPGPILADLRREAFGQERLRTGRLQLPV